MAMHDHDFGLKFEFRVSTGFFLCLCSELFTMSSVGCLRSFAAGSSKVGYLRKVVRAGPEEQRSRDSTFEMSWSSTGFIGNG